MKLKVTFKDPDGVYDSIQKAVNEWTAQKMSELDWASEEDSLKEDIKEQKQQEINLKLCKWLKYSEYVTIEFDLEAEKATVMEN
jgi:hypothetical protein